MTITHAFRHVKWLRSLLTEMGFGWMVDDPTEMYGTAAFDVFISFTSCYVAVRLAVVGRPNHFQV